MATIGAMAPIEVLCSLEILVYDFLTVYLKKRISPKITVNFLKLSKGAFRQVEFLRNSVLL